MKKIEKYTVIKDLIRKAKRFIYKDEKYSDRIGQAYYGITDNGIFGANIMAGIITGIRLTNDKPIYEITYGKSSVWTSKITKNRNELLDFLKIEELSKIKQTAKVEVKYKD